MRKVKGTLVFAKKSNDKEKPMAGAFLQLWDLDLIENDFLAHGNTDKDGNFEILYDPEKGSKWNDIPDLVLRLMDREYAYDKQGQPVSKWCVVKNFHAGKNIEDEVFDFGKLSVSFWEYEDKDALDKVSFTPRVAIIDGKTPQPQRMGRTAEQLQTGLKHFATYNKDKLISKFNKDRPTNEEIEEDYPLNRTRRLKEEARSDAFITDMALNGFNPCMFKKSQDSDLLYVDFNWDGLEIDSRHFAPNTTAYFENQDGQLKLHSIDVKKRIAGNTSAHAQYRDGKKYLPGSPAWDRVKRLFRCNYFLFGEVATHLSETHLNVEQYIVPIRRNLLHNPVSRLLLPHFYGTVDVNLAANDILISSNGLVQKCSALTPNSVRSLCQQSFKTLNWHNWTPRQPLVEGHKFAKIGLLFWDVLQGYVRDFVKDNLPLITEHWVEIRRMSDELVFHSLPYVDPYDNQFAYDPGELGKVNSPHPYINGKISAITPITHRDTPEQEDLENIIQLCCYLLYHATFKHAWVNDLQYEMGGEIEFATLGITDDLTNLNVDEKTVVPPDEAMEHPFITYILNYTEYGYIMRNEDDDINPELIKKLVARRDEFQKLDFDIRALRSCINV